MVITKKQLEEIKYLQDQALKSKQFIMIEKQIRHYLELLNIPPLYEGLTFDSYIIYDNYQRQVFESIKKYVKNFRSNLNVYKNAFFIGKFGCGKTMIAYLMAEELIKKGIKVRVLKFDEIISIVRKTWGKSEEETDKCIKSFGVDDLLIIDEFLRSKLTDDKFEIFTKIFDQRYENKKPTLFISNAEGKEIREIVGERIFSRMSHGKPEIYAFTWSDHRPEAGLK